MAFQYDVMMTSSTQSANQLQVEQHGERCGPPNYRRTAVMGPLYDVIGPFDDVTDVILTQTTFHFISHISDTDIAVQSTANTRFPDIYFYTVFYFLMLDK